LAAWRAYFFIKAWRKKLDSLGKAHPHFAGLTSAWSPQCWITLERLSVSLILLVESFAVLHRKYPLQPWNFTTRSLEHWFGEARRLNGADFTFSEMLFGVRTQDLRSEIFHSGDPKLRSKSHREGKVGYQFDKERLKPGSTQWNDLATYPSKEERTVTVPRLAHKQAMVMLQGLGIKSEKDAAGSAGPAPVSTSGSSLSDLFRDYQQMIDEEDEEEEDDLYGQELETDLAKLAFHDAERAKEIEKARVQWSADEATLKAELEVELDEEEEHAQLLLDMNLGMIANSSKNYAVPPVTAQTPTSHGTTWSSLELLALGAFEDSAINPNAMVRLRRENDTKERLNSERARASKPTALTEAETPDQRTGSRYLREFRETAAAKVDRANRARKESNRQRRWQHRDIGLRKALKSPQAHEHGTALVLLTCAVRRIVDTNLFLSSSQPRAQCLRNQPSPAIFIGARPTADQERRTGGILSWRSPRSVLPLRCCQ
jgi:hypothetical protein